jgi:hypothetical protein
VNNITACRLKSTKYLKRRITQQPTEDKSEMLIGGVCSAKVGKSLNNKAEGEE